MSSLVKEIQNIGRGIEVAVCETCGERVIMGRFSEIFQHEIILEERRSASGIISYQKSQRVDYCPKA